jgi:UDP-N-acetylmuramate: L-alanyl-gamma-D-glutamyl-meso-diaminopimelate ligase
MKLGVMKDLLPASLADADQVFCYAGNLGWDVAEVHSPPWARKVIVEAELGSLVAHDCQQPRALVIRCW